MSKAITISLLAVQDENISISLSTNFVERADLKFRHQERKRQSNDQTKRITCMRISSLLALGLIFPVSVLAQTNLNRGATINDHLDEGAVLEYQIDVASQQFVFAELNQLTVDAIATVLDPNGQIAGSFNTSARGADPIQFETTLSGLHTIRVTPVPGQSGNFSISVQLIENIAAIPEQRLEQLLTAYEGDDEPGAVVAVIRGGKVIHSHSVGMANLQHGIPFSRRTVSNIGSVSKQFTGFAVALLDEQGVLSLDDDIREYFPEIPDLGHVVTIRNLLTHTSGYREFLNLLAMSGTRLGDGDYIDRDVILQILQRQESLQSVPGTEFNYNNTAYALAALLVERVTEQPFQTWMAANIFVPLGMTNTRVRASTGEVIPHAADGYVHDEEQPYRQVTDLGGGGGATMGPGGIYTTVDDLALWMSNMQTGRVGGRKVVDEVTAPYVEYGSDGAFYGLGIDVTDVRGLKALAHGGADTAHRTMLYYFPDIDAGVVATSNNGSFDGSIARKVAESFFAEFMEPLPEKTASIANDESAEIDVDSFDPHLGKYELVDFRGTIIDLSRSGEQLLVSIGDDDEQLVSPISATELRLSADVSLHINLDERGNADSVTLYSPDKYEATRIDEWLPESDQLADFIGRYFSDELETVYDIIADGDGLRLHHARFGDLALTPSYEDTFSAEFPIAEAAFYRDDNGDISGIMVSNGRTQNVRFVKQRAN